MNALKIFEHEKFGEIRVAERDGEPCFVAKDVADALGITWNGTTTIANVPEEWRGVISVNTPSGTQDAICLSEQGLYFFLGRSDKPGALPFQKWLAGEVLPSIRKHGAYMTDSVLEQMLGDPRAISELLTALADERDQHKLAREKLRYLKPNTPYGAPSQITGNPRGHLVKPYWRSVKTTTITETIEWQRSLFE